MLSVSERTFWDNPRFLTLYMSTAYSADQDSEGQRAFEAILRLQNDGELDEPILHSVSLGDLVDMGTRRRQQRDSLMAEVAQGKLPWLFAESLMGNTAWRARFHRTQEIQWFPDDVTSRAELGVYATNQLAVVPNSENRRRLLTSIWPSGVQKSDNRCESLWPPPLSRASQPVSIQTRPVSTNWRALLVSYWYSSICESSRDSGKTKFRDSPRAHLAQKVSNWPKTLEFT
jgi:hypothetical protein